MTVIRNQNPKKKLKRKKTTSGAGFLIEGGHPLKGKVRLGGAKNASFKLMIASLLLEKGEVRLSGLPQIGDVDNATCIIKKLGGKIQKKGKDSLLINPTKVFSFKVPLELAQATRAPIIFAGPLLVRFGKAFLPFPGGDRVGRRPLGRHCKALRKLGVKIKICDNHFEAYGKQLKGTTISFKKNTHTGTEVLIMAAVRALGRTVIKNAACEPEVDDLIRFLNKMGAKIKRRAKRTIVIEGVKKLQGTSFKIMPDRNEAVTFACVALGTKGEVEVENARPSDFEAFLEKVKETGGGYKKCKEGLHFFYKKELKATNVKTAPHPGFMTDWQPLWTTLMTQARGESEVIETIFPNRFSYVHDLKRMGAQISFFNPDVDNKELFYNFNLENDKKEYCHGIKIQGSTKLGGIKARVPNLRAGATLVLGTLIAQGKSEIANINEIDRGYEKLDEKLIKLGAKIRRVA